MPTKVFANSNEIVSKGADGKSVASFPDTCFSPPSPPVGPIPLPYPNTAFASNLENGTTKVFIVGKPIAMEDSSSFSKSTGDEAATSSLPKGIITSQIQGKAYFINWSMNVKAEGKGVPRHLDLTTHNHASIPGNTPPKSYTDKIAPAGAGKQLYDTPTNERKWKMICNHRKNEEKLQPTSNFSTYSIICNRASPGAPFKDTLTFTHTSQLTVIVDGKTSGDVLYPVAQYTPLANNTTLGQAIRELIRFFIDFGTFGKVYSILLIAGTNNAIRSAIKVIAYPDAHYELKLSFSHDKLLQEGSKTLTTWHEAKKSFNTIVNREMKSAQTPFDRDVWTNIYRAKSKFRKTTGKLASSDSSIQVSFSFNGVDISLDIIELRRIKTIVDETSKLIRDLMNCLPKVGLFFEFQFQLLSGCSVSLEWGLAESSSCAYRVRNYRKITIEGELFRFEFSFKAGIRCGSVAEAVIYFKVEIKLIANFKYKDPPEVNDEKMNVGAMVRATPALGAKIEAGKLLKIDARFECDFEIEFTLNIHNKHDGFGDIQGRREPLKAIIEVQVTFFEVEFTFNNLLPGGSLINKRKV